MKQLFIFMLAACFAVFTYAQQAQQFKVGVKQSYAKNHTDEGMGQSSNTVKVPAPDINSGMAAKAVTIRTLGDAGNAWGLSSGNRTFLWADNDLQSVVFPHRMLNPPGTGFLAYDVSTDQGATWEINQQVYDPNLYPAGVANGNARYPQAAIYNPEGNTDPANAVYTYFAPILDGTNSNWGGYGWGANPLTTVNPTTPAQNGLSSPGGDLLFSVPDAYHMTTDGRAIVLEPSLVDGLFANYTGFLIYSEGTYNETTQLFEFTQELLDFDISAGGEGVTIASSKVAFHPDGQTGYIAALSNNGELEQAEGCYYPILFKTENGGEDWDGPYPVQLNGEDGLPAVLNYLTDAFLEYIYEPPIPAREELVFTTAFELDLAVDINGDPHIMFTVGLRGSDEFTIATGWEGLFGTGNSIATIHAASYGGDLDTWYADTLHTPITFRGELGDGTLVDDLRENISVSPSGQELFFSWQVTDIDNIEDNIAPDLYCIGYQLGTGYTDLYNVSAFTEIMWQSWMASGSYYVFDDGAGNYEIPFVCQILDPDDDLQPVQFKYVDDFIITDSDFGVWVGTSEPADEEIISISANYPNPCREMTNINMTLTEYANVQLEVSNLIGQVVKTVNYGPFNTGTHKISVDVSGLDSGIYIYTVTAGKDAVAGKMIVE